MSAGATGAGVVVGAVGATVDESLLAASELLELSLEKELGLTYYYFNFDDEMLEH